MTTTAAQAGAGTDRLARGARRVSALTMLSRLLGLVREQIFALTLGAGVYSDAFLAAFRIPNLLRDLFAEGALSTAFVPTYVATLKNESRAAAYALANRVLSTLTIYLGTIAVLGMLFPQPVVSLVATGFGPEKAALCQQLVRIMMPFLPAISLAVVAMGALNAEERYTAPALASSMFNVVAILGGAVVYFIAPGGRIAVVVWASLTIVGGLAQLGIQIPTLWRMGFRPKLLPDLRLRDAGTRRIATLMAPATLGVAAVQINVVINSSFASLVSDGAISWLSYAFRLMQLPIGVFGVAVATTSLTHLSRDAAARDWEAMRATLRRGLRMVLFLTVPSTMGLALLGVPIIRLIYQHGRFTSTATLATANALSGYALGLVSYAAIKVVGAGVLRARAHARAPHRQRQRRSGKPGLELHDVPSLRPRGPGGRHVGGCDGEPDSAAGGVPDPDRGTLHAGFLRRRGAHPARVAGHGGDRLVPERAARAAGAAAAPAQLDAQGLRAGRRGRGRLLRRRAPAAARRSDGAGSAALGSSAREACGRAGRGSTAWAS